MIDVVAQAADAELRRTFERFVAAQNTHDLQAVGEMLLDSTEVLLLIRLARVALRTPVAASGGA